jgi:hypothetical protein
MLLGLEPVEKPPIGPIGDTEPALKDPKTCSRHPKRGQ